MRQFFLILVLAFCVFMAGDRAAMASSGHYTNGGEGIRLATLPPPGFYYKMYNMFYTASRQTTNSGKKAPGNFDISVYAQAHRFIWSTDIEILGGNVLFDIIIPFAYTDVSYKGIGPASFSDDRFGLGDMFIEPFFVAWHGERWDALAAIGAYVPSGKFDADRPASAGMGFWTFMFSAGGTVYFDEAKTWSISALFRYQVHTQQEETNITPGNHFSFEWGLGKNISGFDIGVAGYCLWQVTEDSGSRSSDLKERAYAIGPEIGYTFDSIGLNVTVRSVWEFENRNRAQGNMTSLNFLYAF